MKNLFFRKTIHDICDEVTQTEHCNQLASVYGHKIRRPKTILISTAENTGKEYIHGLLQEAGIEYPIVVKTNKVFGTKFSHTKYFIQGLDGYEDLYANEELLKEDLIAEELVAHDENILIKVHTIGDEAVFWRVDTSIPKEFMESNIHILQKTDIPTFVRNGQSFCSSSIEELEGEDRINIKFIIQVVPEFVKKFGVSIAGFDFIVSTSDGS